MSPRSAIAFVFTTTTLLVACPQALAAVIGSPAKAQTFTPAPPDLSAYSTTAQLNTDASVTTFADRMAALGLLTTPAQAIALAPVASVNSQTGVVTVPTFSRRFTNVAVNTSTGNATFTFSPAFPNGTSPTCFSDIAATNTNYVFAQPVITSASTTAVTYNVQAALKILSISLGALTVWGPPPTGTVLNVTCIAQNS